MTPDEEIENDFFNVLLAVQQNLLLETDHDIGLLKTSP